MNSPEEKDKGHKLLLPKRQEAKSHIKILRLTSNERIQNKRNKYCSTCNKLQ